MTAPWAEPGLSDFAVGWRTAMRFAVELLDAQRKQLEQQNSYRGKVTNVGTFGATALKSAADQLHELRDLSPKTWDDANRIEASVAAAIRARGEKQG
jgi:hypothetical protein